jgi:hypothetical protein
MSRADALACLKKATTDLAHARRSLADAQLSQRHGLKIDLAFATHVEHSAFNRWLRASAAFSLNR